MAFLLCRDSLLAFPTIFKRSLALEAGLAYESFLLQYFEAGDMIVILADVALYDGGEVVPLVTDLADSQFFLQLPVVKADSASILLDYLMQLGQNDLR
jgi:hypothetical protein